jgi:hypothetical protein
LRLWVRCWMAYPSVIGQKIDNKMIQMKSGMSEIATKFVSSLMY